MRISLPLALSFALFLTGCALENTASPIAEQGQALNGNIHGGQQPISNARVYLLAASASGYGSASSSLIASGFDGTDSIGNYVLSSSTGSFSIAGDYACTSGQQVYLYSVGGTQGTVTNAVAGMMAAVGSCPSTGNFASSVPFIYMNELSTVAFAYATSGFAVDPLHVASSGTALAQTGIANAFAATANLVSTTSGTALATTPAGNGTVPRTEINSLANILAACVNSNGAITGPSSPSNCYTLFNNAKSGTTLPTDTAVAAINIAHNPTAHVSTLFNLQPTSLVFAPGLTSAPKDFSLAIIYTGGGLHSSSAQSNFLTTTVNNIAIDATGNVWKPNYGTNTVSEFNFLGAPVSSTGFSGGGLNQPSNVAIDLTGNVWIANYGGNSVSKFSSAGAPVSGSPFSGGGINAPADLAIDGSGDVWVADATQLSKLTNAGTAVAGSPFTSASIAQAASIALQPSGPVWLADSLFGWVDGYTSAGVIAANSPFTSGSLNGPSGIAIDASGNGWICNGTLMTRLSSTGASGSPYTLPLDAFLFGDAVDGLGNVWASDINNKVLLELTNSGTVISGTVGFQNGMTAVPEAVAIDGSGNVWFSTLNDATIHELVGAAAPVVTPLAYGVKNSLLGTRP